MFILTCHVNFMQNMKLTPSDIQEMSHLISDQLPVMLNAIHGFQNNFVQLLSSKRSAI